jgi:hypothetical protein
MKLVHSIRMLRTVALIIRMDSELGIVDEKDKDS